MRQQILLGILFLIKAMGDSEHVVLEPINVKQQPSTHDVVELHQKIKICFAQRRAS